MIKSDISDFPILKNFCVNKKYGDVTYLNYAIINNKLNVAKHLINEFDAKHEPLYGFHPIILIEIFTNNRQTNTLDLLIDDTRNIKFNYIHLMSYCIHDKCKMKKILKFVEQVAKNNTVDIIGEDSCLNHKICFPITKMATCICCLPIQCYMFSFSCYNVYCLKKSFIASFNKAMYNILDLIQITTNVSSYIRSYFNNNPFSFKDYYKQIKKLRKIKSNDLINKYDEIRYKTGNYMQLIAEISFELNKDKIFDIKKLIKNNPRFKKLDLLFNIKDHDSYKKFINKFSF